MLTTSKTLDERAKNLKTIAREVRLNIIDMIYTAQSGHPGGALSAADIVTALYFDIMKFDPKNLKWPDRDRFILSKGHACPVWYACLAMKGAFPMKELKTLRQLNSILQGHPDKLKTPGVDMTTGSLGQGLSIGVGMALEGKLEKKNYHVFIVLGDGELNEGMIWEAAASAHKYHLDNLIAIVDRNHLQMDGFTEEVMPMEPINKKFQAFNWEVITIDGHNMKEILLALEKALTIKKRPICIIANTVKGKCVDFMENIREWHGLAPNEEQYKKAVECIRKGEQE
ncbi:MAG: transketolase [Candidatus Atribacteria bacterium]|nr:transketolase [Candidatus Atribacteria bacterium]